MKGCPAKLLAVQRFTKSLMKVHQPCRNMQTMREVEFVESVCDRFMAACEATGKSKGEFAASVGLTAQQLSNIARYRNPPSHKVIADAALIYGLTTDFFLTGTLGGMRDETMAERLRQIMARRTAT